jgi:succinyl-diaminopimelate desuccinylase
MTGSADPVAIARDLIRCRSVTPAEGGALAYLEGRLKGAGFETHLTAFAESGFPPIENLFAKIGKGRPHLVFAGHTDVVPAGEEKRWSHAPFGGEVADGALYGRGAVDMKGAIACFIAATLDYLKANAAPKGAISLLITGDEEGPAVNGTVKLLKWAKERGEKFSHAIVGEPTSVKRVGDTIKTGRRGSLSATLTVFGKQGHVAYPALAENPVRALLAMLDALHQPLDKGSKDFEASNLEVTSIDVGNPAFNVIPAETRARFNARFNDKHTSASLKKLIERRLKAAAKGARYRIDYEPASESYLTRRGPFVDLVIKAIKEAAGVKAALSTSGGTSDARFVKNYCPVVDLGLVGQTMHQIDERVPVEDLKKLTAIYRKVIERYFERPPAS